MRRQDLMFAAPNSAGTCSSGITSLTVEFDWKKGAISDGLTVLKAVVSSLKHLTLAGPGTRFRCSRSPRTKRAFAGSQVQMLLKMLDVNNKLEYLEVIAPPEYHKYSEEFRKHHRTPISRPRQSVPTISKITLIGLADNYEKTNLVALGFLPTGPAHAIKHTSVPNVREVYFHKSSVRLGDRHDRHPLYPY